MPKTMVAAISIQARTGFLMQVSVCSRHCSSRGNYGNYGTRELWGRHT